MSDSIQENPPVPNQGLRTSFSNKIMKTKLETIFALIALI